MNAVGPTRARPGSTISRGASRPRVSHSRETAAATVRTSSSTGGSGSASTCRIPKPPPTSIVRGSQSSSRPAAVGELGEQRDREQVRAHVRELRADVDVEALDVEPCGERGADRLDRVVLVEPELGAAVAGADRLVRLRLDSRRDADENAADARGGSAPGLVERVEDDERAGPAAAARSSSSDLLFPCTSRRSPAMPARRANASSPSVETSAPSPSSASRRISATLGNAFVP